MGGFVNAEIIAIRDNLECGHCKSIFQGTDSQARKVKYEDRIVYCSPTCRSAAQSLKSAEAAIKSGKKPRKGVLVGPCPTCGEKFESKIDKIFCSMSCYTKSPGFIERRDANAKLTSNPEIRTKISNTLKKGQDAPCLECGKVFYQKRATASWNAKKFCCMPCYRSYLAKRFDRWIANPQRLALLQNYDEFLNQTELPCLIDGCDWRGDHLSTHMNQSHGVTADEFKRAAGFNLSTGVVSRPLAIALRGRENVGVAITSREYEEAAAIASKESGGKNRDYRSREGAEHRKKARLLVLDRDGPMRICCGCGEAFQQSTPFSRAKYCTVECRAADYSRKSAQKRAAAKG